MHSRPLRIAFVDLTFHWPPEGGCWVDLKEIFTRLAERGFETKLFVPVWTDYYQRGRIDAPLPIPVEKRYFSRFTFNAYHLRKRIGEAVRRWKPDIVFLGEGYHLKPHLLDHFSRDFPTYVRFYSYEVNCLNLHYWLYDENRICDGGFLTDPKRCHRCWHPTRFSFPARIYRLALGKPDNHPQLHFTHEYLTALAFTPWYRKRVKEWLGRAAGLIVYNRFTAEFFRPYNRNVRVVPSGVDTERFAPPPEPPRNPKPVILVPGRLNDDLKGFATVKEACRRLRAEGVEFDLRITAAFNMITPEEWITDLGWISQEEVPGIYGEADIVVVPSLWVEPFGITTLEGMASGLPVVGSRIGGIAETLVDGETGFHYTPGNAEELAEALKKLILNPDLRHRLGEAGRKRAVERYDWDILVEKYYVEPFLAAHGEKGFAGR